MAAAAAAAPQGRGECAEKKSKKIFVLNVSDVRVKTLRGISSSSSPPSPPPPRANFDTINEGAMKNKILHTKGAFLQIVPR